MGRTNGFAAKIGRPSKYTMEIAQAIADRLTRGETLNTICRDAGMPDASSVRRWALDDVEGFWATYDRARELGCRR